MLWWFQPWDLATSIEAQSLASNDKPPERSAFARDTAYALPCHSGPLTGVLVLITDLGALRHPLRHVWERKVRATMTGGRGDHLQASDFETTSTPRSKCGAIGLIKEGLCSCEIQRGNHRFLSAFAPDLQVRR